MAWPSPLINARRLPEPMSVNLLSATARELDKYPGLGLPLRQYPQYDGRFFPMGAHANCYGSKSELLPVREVAMMNVMDRLTDKKDWHEKVFDNEIVEKWRKEALEIPDDLFWNLARVPSEWGSRLSEDTSPLKEIMNSETFDYCVKELRNKARSIGKTGVVPTLDANATVVKSDSLIDPELHEAVKQAFKDLIAEQATNPDWHPGSNNLVQDLLHPSMYPLVYGESKVIAQEVVGVEDAIPKWAGKGDVIKLEVFDDEPTRFYAETENNEGGLVPSCFWSEKYQWLPANLAFQDDGSVKFTSYINNLHPTKHSGIYRTIEKLVEKALPMWDQCLSTIEGYEEDHHRGGAGRTRSRYIDLGDCDDSVWENWEPTRKDFHEHPEARSQGIAEDDRHGLNEIWRAVRKPIQREPQDFEEIDYAVKPTNRLAEKFKDSGLQIIVKMASIELRPDRPYFPQGSWHVEGQMNEAICATTLFYADEENIEPSSLSFRMQTSQDTNEEDRYAVGQHTYSWLSQIHGTDFGMSGSCLQNYGNVQTPQGRLLAFPNVFQHRVSPFETIDKEKPGHRRFIALWLVDPHHRIISTANVPPQQEDWWTEALIGQDEDQALSKLPAELVQLLREEGLLSEDGVMEKTTKGELPPELMNIVRGYFEGPAMSKAKAKEHRQELMDARTDFQHDADELWKYSSYNFCEH